MAVMEPDRMVLGDSMRVHVFLNNSRWALTSACRIKQGFGGAFCARAGLIPQSLL